METPCQSGHHELGSEPTGTLWASPAHCKHPCCGHECAIESMHEHQPVLRRFVPVPHHPGLHRLRADLACRV
jgi:hypothetical protein